MPAWVDSHCHLQERFVDDDAHEAVAQLTRARADGVVGVVCVGTDDETSRQAVALARAAREGRLGSEIPALAAVVGLHPHEAERDRAWLARLVAEEPELVAGIGECGLDYYYEHAPKAAQRDAFVAQIHLAHEANLPLVIHARDAWADLFSILDSEGVPERTVLHCFTGGPDEAVRCVERAMSVSFSGIVTFKNAQETRAAVADVPLSHLLVETDSPFLAPVPHRGKTNEPAYVALVGEAVAEASGDDPAHVATQSAANAARIFGLELA